MNISEINEEREYDLEFAQINKSMGGLDNTIERLEGIRDAIASCGICKSMMFAADPKGELAAAGIVPAYEGLEDAPVKDENATASIEGIDEVIKTAVRMFIKMLQSIGEHLKKWALWMIDKFTRKSKIIKDKMDATTEEAYHNFNSSAVVETVYSVTEIQQLAESMKELDHVVDLVNREAIEYFGQLSELDKDLSPILARLNATTQQYCSLVGRLRGFTVRTDEIRGVAITYTHLEWMPQTKSLKDLGYNSSNVKSVLELANHIIDSGSGSYTKLRTVADTYFKQIDKLHRKIYSGDTRLSDSEMHEAHHRSKVGWDISAILRDIMRTTRQIRGKIADSTCDLLRVIERSDDDWE